MNFKAASNNDVFARNGADSQLVKSDDFVLPLQPGVLVAQGDGTGALASKRMDTGSPWILANNPRAPSGNKLDSAAGSKSMAAKSAPRPYRSANSMPRISVSHSAMSGTGYRGARRLGTDSQSTRTAR